MWSRCGPGSDLEPVQAQVTEEPAVVDASSALDRTVAPRVRFPGRLQLQGTFVDQPGVVELKAGHRTEAGFSWTSLTVIQSLSTGGAAPLFTVFEFLPGLLLPHLHLPHPLLVYLFPPGL